MLPGRQYRPEDVWYLIVKWRWLVLLPWVAISIGTVIYARMLPDRYRSDSIIQVVPQRVSENYVRSAINSKLGDRLPAISQQILSRTKLERIIQDFSLYTEERRTELMEDIVKGMRDDIGVAVVKGDAFVVSYSSTDARTAMKVTERLASLFIEENLRDREVLAEGANQFLDSQLDDARRRLVEHEKKLEDYRRQNAGELPSQMQANLQAIGSLQSQIQQFSESILRDRDRRLILERQLTDAVAEGAVLAEASRAGVDGDTRPQPAAVQLETAKSQLQAMQLRLKADHPDVKQMKSRIKELEKRADIEALQVPVSPSAAPRQISPAEAMRQSRMRDINREIESLDRDIGRKEEGIKRAQAAIPTYQNRVEATPTRESEMIALTRDYDTLQKVYTNLLFKGEDAKVSANLERRQIGEQFKVIDAARLPGKPYSPDRAQVYGAGIGGGLLFGLAIVGLIEYKDSSFRTDNDVVSVLALPVLANIPTMVTAAEKRAMKRMRVMVAAASLVAVASGGAVFAFRSHILAWLR